MNVDNITLPTTVDGIRNIISPFTPIHLTNGAKPNSDLPGYVYVGQSGYDIYASITEEQKVLACTQISSIGHCYSASMDELVSTLRALAGHNVEEVADAFKKHANDKGIT